jgi:hypothetical protein
MIGTPCGGGVVHANYLLSFLETYNQSLVHKHEMARQLIAQFPGGFNQQNPEHVQALNLSMQKHTLDLSLYTMVGESLLARGRNHIAAQALYEGFDKLFFIDSDEGWSWDSFAKIAFSPHPFIAGCVPLKAYPNPGSFETSLNFLPYQDDEKYFQNGIRTLGSTREMAKAHGGPIVKVAFTGTGFLCISREVLAKLAEGAEEYLYPNPYTKQSMVHWNIFDGGPIAGQYLSEDWTLCEKVRNLGYDILINTEVLCNHMGPHTFHAG